MTLVVHPVYVQLSPRELVVLREFLRDGADNAQIGRRAYVTEDTVKTHMRRIFAKVGVTNRAELAIRVLRGDVTLVDSKGRRILVGPDQ